jgi:integrase
MAILAECPICHTKQSTKNKKCKCGVRLDEAKKEKKVRYWIAYRMPDGTQKRESVGAFKGLKPYSIKDAKDALAKRSVQKREKTIFDTAYNMDVTFNEMTEWYLNLKSVKKKKSLKRLTIALNKFNSVLGHRLLSDVNSIALEDFQEELLDQGLAPSTVDITLGIAKTMVKKVFDADKIKIGSHKVKINGDLLRAFNSVDRKLIRGSNARQRVVTIDEYLKLLKKAPKHLKPMIIVAMNTGMRPGEIKGLKWSYIDKEAGFIRLPAGAIKEGSKTGMEKSIPINHNVMTVLDSRIRALHHDYVFTYGTNPITGAKGITKSFRTACKKADIAYGKKVDGGLIFHDFRRTVKTNMLKAGLEKEYRDTILGHSLKGMDVHYLVPDDKTLTEAMDKYTNWLDADIETKLQNVDHFVDQVANLEKAQF